MKITSANFVISNTKLEFCPKDNKPEFAFIGRSNVGKSSLINMITSQKKLAMTSSTPGKTLLINHFLINEEWYLVDLPGYGYAKRDKKQLEKLQKIIKTFILKREELTSLFVLLDIRIKPQDIDLKFIEFLGINEIPFALIFTKTDKLKRGELKKNVTQYKETLLEKWEELPPIFISSAKSGLGRDDITNYIEEAIKATK